jgi:two-component system response regulator WspF
MGADGAQGMLRLKQAGWHTIAQDQSTCVVYGMPKAAVKLNAVTEVLPLDEIAQAIIHAVHTAVTAKDRKPS